MEKFFKLIEAKNLKREVPAFNIGDTVDVQVKIVEEGKTRLQTFEGIVIARKGSGLRETFTVRKISYGEGVERVFPLHSPAVDKIVVVKKGDVRRAKLYYLKKKVGKETKVDEKIQQVEGSQTPPAGTAPQAGEGA
ncbi:MAG: 50S ribosomal protein L19 [Candidatus Omnitrophica bacterium]|nr:50S ribosomal protein L19 [Candidatus Omnitrophota bacterium]